MSRATVLGHVHPCDSCGRLIGSSDAHRRCQRCRDVPKWAGRTARYQREWRRRKREAS